MTIGEFSGVTGISVYTLRYYEKKGLLSVNRDSNGRRYFSENDVEWVRFIKCLKDTGMLLRDIKHYSDLRYQGDATIEERMDLLTRHRKTVLEEQKKWKEYLDNLDMKIKIYREQLHPVIGKVVTVVIDRPLGSCHPVYQNVYYPINYGYVEGVMAADGEEQDAYILGVDKAAVKFTGKVIAVIHRKDDIEDKWVVCPEHMFFTEDEIKRQIYFQEQYFDIQIWMR